MKSLIQFLCSITKQLKKSKAGLGINLYDTAVITKHKTEIERLCSDCGWRLSHFAESTKYDADTGEEITLQASYYVGPAVVGDTEDDLLSHFGDKE